MTTGEFIEALAKVQERFKWVLVADGGRHTERRAQARLRVRGFLNEGPAQGIGLDPIGAACYARTHTLYEPEYWEDAAKAIRLPLAHASALNAAANDRTWKDVEGQRKPDEHLQSLRRQLIETVHLKNPFVKRSA